MRGQSQSSVLIAVAILVAVVALPFGVRAAVGEVVNIADKTNAQRIVRVTRDGTLTVESRAGARAGAFNVQSARSSVGWIQLAETRGPRRIAVTEMTITPEGPAGPQSYRIETWIQKGTSGTCSTLNLGDFDKHILRQVSGQNNETIALNFNGPPLMTPPAAQNRLVCLGVVARSAPNGSSTYAGATGYKFTP